MFIKLKWYEDNNGMILIFWIMFKNENIILQYVELFMYRLDAFALNFGLFAGINGIWNLVEVAGIDGRKSQIVKTEVS